MHNNKHIMVFFLKKNIYILFITFTLKRDNITMKKHNYKEKGKCHPI